MISRKIVTFLKVSEVWKFIRLKRKRRRERKRRVNVDRRGEKERYKQYNKCPVYLLITLTSGRFLHHAYSRSRNAMIYRDITCVRATRQEYVSSTHFWSFIDPCLIKLTECSPRWLCPCISFNFAIFLQRSQNTLISIFKKIYIYVIVVT